MKVITVKFLSPEEGDVDELAMSIAEIAEQKDIQNIIIDVEDCDE